MRNTSTRGRPTLLFMAFAMLLALPATALADEVRNDVVVNGNDTITAGGSTTIKYKINPGSAVDTQAGCNVSDGSPATVHLGVPAKVTASAASLTFNKCNEEQAVTFSSNVAGSYPISVSRVVDAGGGTYYYDNAGFTLKVNAATPSDTTAPVINSNVAGTQGLNGWYTSDVAVSWSVTDPESTISSQSGCGTTNITSDQGETTYTCSATSAGGMSSKSVTIKRDATAPQVTPGAATTNPNGAGWYKGDITIDFTASDGRSGLADPTKASFPQTTSGEGTNVKAISGDVYDNAGNKASAQSAGFKIDKTAPEVAYKSASPAVNAAGWRNVDGTATFEATDPLSGMGATDAEKTATDTAKTSGEGTNVNVGSPAFTDRAGNTALAGKATSPNFKIDKTAPGVSASVSPDVATSGWYNQATGAPTVKYSCSDGLSGLSGTCPSDHTFGEGANQGHSSGDVSDLAGNKASASVSGIKVDLTAPAQPGVTFTPANPVANSGGYFKDTVAVNYGPSSDDGSGVKNVSANQTFDTTGTHSYSGVAEDNAGNKSAATSGSVKVDANAPEVGPASVANSVWRDSALSQSFKATDSGSGLNASGLAADGSLNFELTASAESQDLNSPTVDQRTISDKVGHSVTRSVSALIDLTKPNISASVLNDPAASGWYNKATGAPVVRFQCSDALSGIAAGACPADHTIATEGSNQGYSDSVSDRAGNENSAGVSGLKIDLTAPNAAEAPDLLDSSDSGDTSDNLTNDQTPTFDIVAEAGSTVRLYGKKDGAASATLLGSGPATNGMARITSGQSLSDGVYTIHAEVTDQAGNVSSTDNIKVTIVTVDATPPDAPTGLDMAASSDSGIKNDDDVTNVALPLISGNAEKGSDVKLYEGTTLLGSAKADTTSGNWSITSSALSEGRHTMTAKTTDAAGNTSQVSGSLLVAIDKTAPGINDNGPTTDPNGAGWYKTNVTNKFTASDALSGLANATDATIAKTTQGEGRALKVASGPVADVAGNVAPSVDSRGFDVDKTAPTNVSGTPDRAANANGWYKSAVTVSFDGQDALSGIANCPSATYNGPDDGAASVGGSCTDLAGNSANGSFGLKYDATAPTLAPSVSPNPVLLNGSATATAGAQDNLSGVASQGCDPVNTSSVGAKSVSCSATDDAGNQNNARASYNVNYNFAGYRQPVDNNNVLNTAKAGSAIPMKFSLFGNQGLNIIAAGYPKVTAVACATGTTSDAIEELATTNSGLTYDATADQYNYVWKTQSTYAGKCFKFDMVLTDGTSHTALFKFTK